MEYFYWMSLARTYRMMIKHRDCNRRYVELGRNACLKAIESRDENLIVFPRKVRDGDDNDLVIFGDLTKFLKY